MKLETVKNLLWAIRKAETYRRLPESDEGCCVGGDGIFMNVGKQEICVVNSIYFQGSLSKRYEIIEMLPIIQKLMPEFEFYYNDGWMD